MQIVPLAPAHWEEAAALAAARVAALRGVLPMLPAQYEQGEAIYVLLAELAGRAPGVAALVGGRLVGFLTAMSLPSFKSKRAAFSPEWANAALDKNAVTDAGAIYQALYAALAPVWLANGCYIHALRVLAHDRRGLEGLYWQGFGLNNVDAIRDLTPLAAAAPGVVIRQATAADIDAVVTLGEGLQRHLAAPPIYLPLLQLDSRADYLAWLAQPGHVQWLACRGDEVVAELRLEPTNYTACAVAADPGTVFITSAYTVPAARQGGLAAALLAHALADARARGCSRIATDFESANIPGAAFWLHHFQPLGYSVVRYVDERAAYAHAARRAEDFW
jgi:GNAT superfamily N-acetyltransferase